MKIAILFSGGKDSTYSAYLVKNEGHELTCLISLISENPDSYMFQQVEEKKIKEIAGKMNIPVVIQKTKGVKEVELGELESAIKSAIKKYKIEGLVTGAVASNYQASRIQKICDGLGIKCINPLWGIDPEIYWENLLSSGFKIKIVKVAADGFGEEWAGKIIDRENFEKMKKLSRKYKFNLSFEGGEAETEVVECPLFHSARGS